MLFVVSSAAGGLRLAELGRRAGLLGAAVVGGLAVLTPISVGLFDVPGVELSRGRVIAEKWLVLDDVSGRLKSAPDLVTLPLVATQPTLVKNRLPFAVEARRQRFSLEPTTAVSRMTWLRRVVLVGGLAVGAWGLWRRDRPARAMAMGALLSLTFNVGLHTIWGPERFLYSSHWLFALLVLLAGIPFGVPRPRAVATASLTLLLLVCAVQNVSILGAMLAHLEVVPNRERPRFSRERPAESVSDRAGRRDVVLLLVDTLRARQLGFHGYPYETSPELDELARKGVVFERASSASSYTRESVASLFTGLTPTRAGATGWSARPAADTVSLAESYRDAGYRTALVTASSMLEDPLFLRGFGERRDVGRGQMLSGTSHEVTQEALGLVRDAGNSPVFLFVHYLDPHGPYAPSAALRERFARGKPVQRSLRLYEDVRKHADDLVASGLAPGDARYEDLVERYDAELADTDQAIGELVRGLDALGRLDRTLLVVTADHGEEFLEHGFVDHGWTLYEESLHVPLLILAPGMLEPGRVAHRVSAVDVAPTLRVLSGLEPLPSEGIALFEKREAGWRPVARTGPVFAELGIQSRLLLRSVVDGDWKYIAARKWLAVEARSALARAKRVGPLPADAQRLDPWGPIVREELYDLVSDPQELVNRTDATERLEAMRAQLDARRPSAGERPQADSPTPLDERERERLEALGYF